MLVLSRKVGECILVGDQVRITVVRVSGGGVRIGIEAPADLAVVREELVLEQLKSGDDGFKPGGSKQHSVVADDVNAKPDA